MFEISAEGAPEKVVILGFEGASGTVFRRCDLVWSSSVLRLGTDDAHMAPDGLRLVVLGVAEDQLVGPLRPAEVGEPAVTLTWVGRASDDVIRAAPDLRMPRLATGTIVGESRRCQCGDGERDQLYEECDDGAFEDGDGCSSDCDAEAGWTCDRYGCSAICGDRLVRGDETCDDGNTTLGDGCYRCRL